MARSIGSGFLLFVLGLVPAPSILAAAPDNILIQNVRLIRPNEASSDVLVNILVTNKNLEIVTRDTIPPEEASLTLDGESGYLLGRLSIGQAPSFLIFDADPRSDVDVLLDTKTHARFVIRKGEILKNQLNAPTASSSINGEIRKAPTWLAYTPPPLALPISYLNETKWNRWDSRFVDGIFVAATIIDRQKWISQSSSNVGQVGDLSEFSRGEIRGLRFGSVGTINFKKPWVYTIFAASNAFSSGFDEEDSEGYSLLDYRLDIPLVAGVNLSVGKQKEPISMQRLMPLTNTPMQERSMAADAMLRSRNFGAVLSGSAFNRRMTWAGGLFNDWIDSGESFNESSEQFVSRVTAIPFVSEDQSNLFHLGLGWRYSDARGGLRYFTKPEFYSSPNYVDTGVFEADSATTLSIETSWRRGPLWIDGEYVRTAVDASSANDPELTGYHIGASWTLTGEMRPYNLKNGTMGALPVSASVYQGGIGTWELAMRWSALDFADSPIESREVNVLSLGVNWWLSPTFSTGINYRRIDLDNSSNQGTSNGINARVTLILE